MSRTMRAALTAFLLLWSGWLPAAADTRPVAVWFYADWCLNCKLIAPKLAQVESAYTARVNFLKLDFTTDDGKKRNKTLAREFGFYDLYLSNKATGWVALIGADGRRRGELRHFMSVDDMRAALDQVLSASQ